MPVELNRPGEAMTPEQMAAERAMNPNAGKGRATNWSVGKPVMFNRDARRLPMPHPGGRQPLPTGSVPFKAKPGTGGGIQIHPPAQGGMAKGGAVGGKASSRADGCAQRGKTKGKFV
jgi:hypothetical protein